MRKMGRRGVQAGAVFQLCLMVSVIYLFALYLHFSFRFEGSQTTKDPTYNFRCIQNDPAMWKERVNRNREFLDASASCQGKRLGSDPLLASGIPVVFVFQDLNPLKNFVMVNRFFYVDNTINTAAMFNERVFLILVGRLRDYQFRWKLRPNVHVIEVRQGDVYSKTMERVATMYVHRAPNEVSYELFCVQRWFLVLELVRQHGLDQVFVADNDVLLLSNVTMEVQRCYPGCRSVGFRVPALYLSRLGLESFIGYMERMYAQDSKASFGPLLQTYGTISDMILHIGWQEEELREGFGANKCFNEVDGGGGWGRGAYPRLPFQGDFPFFYQDEMDLVHYVGEGYTPTYVSVLHFNGWRKRLLEHCPYFVR